MIDFSELNEEQSAALAPELAKEFSEFSFVVGGKPRICVGVSSINAGKYSDVEPVIIEFSNRFLTGAFNEYSDVVRRAHPMKDLSYVAKSPSNVVPSKLSY